MPKKKDNLTPQDTAVNNQAQRTLRKRTDETLSIEMETKTIGEVLGTYNQRFLPITNRKNLESYNTSKDFTRHAKTARIYYNMDQLSGTDALRIISQREPTNIAMGSSQYNKDELNELFGYEVGIYNDPTAVKEDGTHFKDLPNTAAVYSETYLWDPPGGNQRKEVACLSLPAPALDTK